ncbi:pyrroloquinoline quinone biosynthesis protein PqqE [compost metagenome]
MDREQWYSLIRSFRKLGGDELLFIGGEPLLQKELLLDLIRFSRMNHIRGFTVYTNGQLLDEETLKLFSSYQVKVKLQLSSLDEDTNESITGVRYGHEEMSGLIENMLGAFIEVQPVLLVSRYNEHQVEKTIADLKKISSKLKPILDFLYPKPANPHYSSKWEGAMYEKTKQFGKVSIEKLNHLRMYNECLYGQVAVTETGEVLPCPMMRDLSLGNIANDELVDILNESNYNDFISMNKDQVGKCSGCSFRYNCSDCRALERAATGQFEQMEYCSLKL